MERMNFFMQYDVIIIGAGPGGIFSAYELSKLCPEKKIAVFEEGQPLEKRKCPIDGKTVKHCVGCPTCAIMNGFGGAGAFSDGKYNLTNDFGGTLYEYIGKKQAMELMHYVDAINVSHGGENTRLYSTANSAFKTRCLQCNLHLLDASVRHLGTDINFVVLKNLFAELEPKVDFYFRTPVRQVLVADGGYEMVAGHRRKCAATLAGITEMPCIVRNLSDDEATIIMVDSNLQRESLLPSERAFAYRMKYEALKRQGRRTDLTLVQVEPKLKKRWAAEMVGTEVGETMSTIKRYIRLTYLSNYLLEFVDKNELPFTVAVDLSYLKSNEQSLLLAFIGTTKKMPNGSQAKKLKELSQQKELTGEDIEKILRGEAKVNYQKISFSEKQLQKYFPPDYKKEQIEKIIFQLLDSWKAQTEQRG